MIEVKDESLAADVQGLAASKEKICNSIKRISYDCGNCAGAYVPSSKVLRGGYSSDGETFDDDFIITDVDEKDAHDALKFCAGLYVEFGTIHLSFNELKNVYDEVCKREENIHYCEQNLFD